MKKPSANWSIKRQRVDWRQTGLHLGLVALAYWLALLASLTIRLNGIAAFWVADGIALAALVLAKPSERPGIVVLVFFINLFSNLASGNSFAVSLGFTTANTLESAIGAWLMLRWQSEHINFEKLADVLALFAVVSIVNGGTAILGALTGSLGLGGSFQDLWGHWIVENGLCLLLVMPLIITWKRAKRPWYNQPRLHVIEDALLMLTIILLTFITTRDIQHETLLALRVHIFFPLFIWLALRFSPRGVTLGLALFSTIILLNTFWGNGTLFANALQSQALYVQLYLGVVLGTVLLLSAIFSERRRNEREFHAILHTSSEGYWKLDAQGHLLDVNEVYCHLSGYARAELLRMTVSDLEAVEEPQQTQAHISSTISKGADRFETRHRRKDGTIIDVEISVTFLPQEHEFIVFVRDISERIQAERSRRASEQLAQSTIDALSANICVLDENGVIISVNHAWREFANANPLALSDYRVGANYLTICDNAHGLHSEHGHALADGLRAMMQGERKEFMMEYPCDLPGEPGWFNARVTRFATGSTWHFVVAHENITDRKLIEEDLRASEVRLKAYFDLARVAIIILDRNGKWLEVNKYAEQLLGYSEQELTKMHGLDITHPDDIEATREGLRSLAEGKLDSFHLEKRYMRKNGEIVWVDISASTIRKLGDAPVTFIAAAFDITERKKAEDALRESETTYRQMFANNSAILLLIDPTNGAIIYANFAASQYYGYSQDDLCQMRIQQINTLSLDQVAAHMKEAEQHSSNYFLFQHRLASGEIRDVEVYSTPMYVSGRRLLQSIIHDITDRKRAEQALRESEERFRKLIEEAPIAITVSRLGTPLYVNPKYLEMFGCASFDEIGASLVNHFALQEQSRVAEYARLRMEGLPAPAEFESIGMRKDGSLFLLQMNVTTVQMTDGLATVAFLQDVTERKRGEEQLRKLSRAVEQSPASIVITDTSGAIEYVNPKFTQITGYTPNEAIGKNPRILKSGRTPPEEYKKLWKTIKAGSEWRGEFYNRKKNGDTYWEMDSISPVANEEGIITHFVAVKEDITERKRVEAISAARSRILQFSLGHSLPDILQNVLDECEALTSSSIGFFHFMLADQNTLALQNWSTRTLNEFCQAEGKGAHYPLSQAGVWADCVQERRALIANDYATMPNRKGMPTGHAVVNRFISIPILRGENIVAIIGVGNKPTEYNERDVQIVTQLADLSWDIT